MSTPCRPRARGRASRWRCTWRTGIRPARRSRRWRAPPPLLRRHVGKAELPRHRPVALDHVHQPGRAGVVEEELGVLAGEVLVVQMQPVVGLELVAEHLGIPDLLELDPGVVERHRHRVVPRRGVGRRVDRHLGRLLQRHRVHVAACESRPGSGRPAPSSSGSIVMPVSAASRAVAASAGQQERAAPVVEEPLRLGRRARAAGRRGRRP